MAAINDLIRQIPDAALRARLEQEFDHLSKTKLPPAKAGGF